MLGAAYDDQAREIEKLKHIIHALLYLAEHGEIPAQVTIERWKRDINRREYTRPASKMTEIEDAMHEILRRHNPKCICNVPANKGVPILCPAHGNQMPGEMCPQCQTHVLAFCPQGCYCTSDDCRYIS